MTTPIDPLPILLVGCGRMGRAVEAVSAECGCQVVGRIDKDSITAGGGLSRDRWPTAEVAIDFTTADAFVQNFPRLALLGLDVVVGTTGWNAHEAEMRTIADRAGIGVVAAPNFSIGVALFELIVAEAARLFADQAEFGAWLHEIHHAAKRDAPSGTALRLKASMEASGYRRAIDVASNRAGSVPGTHTVGFDGPSETITVTHAARDRGAFARGALKAARFVHGRRGWYDLRDVILERR
ncbi:MAG: 4-hydroxy-tetrahydrodipicolinate reductase [Bacteroidales bacterium]